VADGYGSSFVHAFDKNTGKYIAGKTFGGMGNSSSDPIKFHTPHGIALDPRHPVHKDPPPLLRIPDVIPCC